MNTLITYLSKTGITRKYAAEMNAFLRSGGHETQMQSIHDAEPADAEKAEAVLLGAWCHGLFIFLQHPDKDWVKYARQLPDLKGKKVVLFTTYKLATGSMFRKMKKSLRIGPAQTVLELKSRNGSLSESDRKRLTVFLTGP